MSETKAERLGTLAFFGLAFKGRAKFVNNTFNHINEQAFFAIQPDISGSSQVDS